MQKTEKGFTLLELLVVIAIIGILASVVVIALGTARANAAEARAKADVRQIVEAIQLLENDTGQWPDHQPPWSVYSGVDLNEVWDLGTAAAGLTQTDGGYTDWKGPYIQFAPTDPWGNPYFLDTDYKLYTDSTPCGQPPRSPCHDAVVVGSFGPNGIGQNRYDSDDVIFLITN